MRQHLGYNDMENSYTHFLVYKLTGINFSQSVVDIGTAAVFFISFAASIVLNIRDWQKKRVK